MYVRDKRSPVPKNETVSRVMSANRAKNTKPEILLRKALWQAGARGYRLHRPVRTRSGSDGPPDPRASSDPTVRTQSGSDGPPDPRASSDRSVRTQSGSDGPPQPRTSSTVRPDISFVSKKVAIFVNGCYWHRCPKCNYTVPKTNSTFWQTKFENNVARDERKRKELLRLGWKVITVWECDLKKRFDVALNRILRALN